MGWRVLSRWADHFVSMPDHIAAAGMRVLGAPVLGDGRIVSGESGAAGFGLALLALSRTELAPCGSAWGWTKTAASCACPPRGPPTRLITAGWCGAWEQMT